LWQLAASASEQLASLEKSADEVLGYSAPPAAEDEAPRGREVTEETHPQPEQPQEVPEQPQTPAARGDATEMLSEDSPPVADGAESKTPPPSTPAPETETQQPAPPVPAAAEPEAAAQWSAVELQAAMCIKDAELASLRSRLAQREAALERAAAAASSLVHAAGEGEDWTSRLEALSAQVAALTRERDSAVKALTKAGDSSALVAEKDGVITAVMAEGAQLSKKVGDLEAQSKKLRVSLREGASERERLAARLKEQEVRCAEAERAKEAAEAGASAALERALADVRDSKAFYAAELQKAQAVAAQTSAGGESEARAALERRLKEAHEREAALTARCSDLTGELARRGEEAGRREDGLRAEAARAALREREAEARHEDLAARLPEATRPLLRQMEAMQRAASERADAWAASEALLTQRAQASEETAGKANAQAQAAREAARLAEQRCANYADAQAAATSQLAACREEAEQRLARCEALRGQAVAAAAAAAAASAGREAEAQAAASALEAMLRSQLSQERARVEAVEASARAEAEEAALLVAELRQRLAHVDAAASAATATNRAPEAPPAPRAHAPPPALTPARAARASDAQLALAEARISSLEATRSSLADELVALSAKHAAAVAAAAESQQLREHLAASLTLLGERDERVEGLEADVGELRKLAQRQAEMLTQPR